MSDRENCLKGIEEVLKAVINAGTWYSSALEIDQYEQPYNGEQLEEMLKQVLSDLRSGKWKLINGAQCADCGDRMAWKVVDGKCEVIPCQCSTVPEGAVAVDGERLETLSKDVQIFLRRKEALVKVCWNCNGTGIEPDSSYSEYCSVCNGDGVLKRREEEE